MRQQTRNTLAVVWASPWSLVGLGIGSVALLTGGRAQFPGRAIEFHGGFAKWFLQRMPNGQFVLAMTLGHTILGQNAAALDIARSHERIHVRQYEIWGPFFGPAYLLSSLAMWVVGRDPYRDNAFEREAYAKQDLPDPPTS